MGIASGVAKQLRYKLESAYGVPAGAASGQLLRRVTSSLDLNKETFQSQEIRPDYQIADFRHGVRRVAGSINGELSPNTYSALIAAALRRAMTVGATATTLSITISGSGPVYTVNRAAGSWLTSGIKVGRVVALTAGSFAPANLNNNLLVLTVTASDLTVIVINGSSLVAEGPIASATLTVRGQETFVPVTGHLDQSFSIEHWFPDVPTSELFLGCKVNTLSLDLPPTGMATIDIGVMGQNVQVGTSEYFTAPTSATGTGITAAVNGALIVDSVPVAICTGLSMNIEGGINMDQAVVGSNQVPFAFPGRVNVTGEFSAYFDSGDYRDAFFNEDEITLAVVLTTDNGPASDFLAFTLPRLKLGGATKTDGEQGIIVTAPYQALFNPLGGTGTDSDQTTIVFQESV
jgi:hypothetical protein